MVLGIRQRAGSFSHSSQKNVWTISLSFLFLVEVINGQPNYYFKASGIDAPAVKSLPRIGRRSDGEGMNGPFTRDLSSDGILDMWQASSNPSSVGDGLQIDSLLGRSSSSSGGPGRSSPLNAPMPNQMSKALLWRKLFGEGMGNYEDSYLDNFYRSKS